MSADDLSTLLTRNNVRPVMPVAEAVDFTLTDLEGNEVSLSDFQGKWVLLTFWATWCGPCLSEMPSLQRFWERHGEAGIAVVGVAVGSPENEVRSVVQRKGVTFPVLIDVGDRVSSRYQAWSVPVAYLVDPGGQLVGMIRGARDWSRADSLVAGLLALGGEGEAQEYGGTAEGPIALPADLVPPTAQVSLPTAQPVAGEPFEMLVRVAWADAGEDYRIHPPRLELPSGVEQDAVSASSSSADGTKVLTYSVSLRAEEPGSYPLDPVEIRFTPSGQDQPLAIRVAGPTAIVGAALGPLRWTLPAAVAVLVVVVTAVLTRLRAGKQRKERA